AMRLGPAATIDAITESGLRGRGGGGFPTGRKWAGIAAQTGSRRYLVVNGAEGEPGTFKDRALLRANPYQAVEGLTVAAVAGGRRGRSRTGRVSAPTRTWWARGWSSPRSRWGPSRPTSASRGPSSGRDAGVRRVERRRPSRSKDPLMPT